MFRTQTLYLLPNIFNLLDALGHLLEAAINLTWPGRKDGNEYLLGQQAPKDKVQGLVATGCTLEFTLVRHLPCPTDALSSYSLGDGRCWER